MLSLYAVTSFSTATLARFNNIRLCVRDCRAFRRFRLCDVADPGASKHDISVTPVGCFTADSVVPPGAPTLPPLYTTFG